MVDDCRALSQSRSRKPIPEALDIRRKPACERLPEWTTHFCGARGNRHPKLASTPRARTRSSAVCAKERWPAQRSSSRQRRRLAPGGTIEANSIRRVDRRVSARRGSLARNGNFALLWAGQFVSQLGDRLAMVAVPWLVYRATGSALSTGVAFALYTLPYVLFGAVAGVLIDRLDKRLVMIASDLARVALVMLVPLAAERSLWAVYGLSFLIASAAVFFDPCKLALLPDLVPREKLLRANSLLATGENLTEILGYTAAGFLLAYISTANVFRIDAATFAVSAVSLALIRYKAPVRAAGGAVARSFRRELREGFAFLRHHRGLLTNTIMVVGCVAGLGASYPLAFLLAVDVFDAGTAAFGVFEGMIGLGYLVGSLALAALAQRVPQGRAMVAGLMLMGASLSLVAAAGGVWVACVPFAVLGVANAAALIAIDTYLQSVVPEHLRGRVFGTRFTLTQGVYALAVLAGGALATVVDVRVLFIVCGLLIAVPALAGLFVREIRDA